MSDPSEKGFVVVDKRASAGAADAEPAAAAQPPEPPRAASGPRPADAPTPAVDFATLVQSFFVTALYHLGLAADPETGQAAAPNLPAARQNIEILELLEAKTRGNLETEEARLLEGVLYELRMRFVEVGRASRA
jgi:hypothetical protein